MVLLSLTSTNHSKPHDFEVNYSVPLEVLTNSEIALIGCNMSYSWHNISVENNTNKLIYYDGEKWDSLIFPEGNYDFDDIQDYIKDHFKTEEPPISIHANTVTLRTILQLKSGFKLDLTVKSSGLIHKMFGFDPEILEEPRVESTYKADITMGVNRVLIHCSIVGGTYENSAESDVIYSFVPNAPPGSILNIHPFHPIYLPLKDTVIRKIRMMITDEKDRFIELNGQHIGYLLNIR